MSFAKVLAIDCETVKSYDKNLIARVTLVDVEGKVVFNEIIKPASTVTNYRSFASEDKKKLLENGKTIEYVRGKVNDLIFDCILVGYFLDYQIECLGLCHEMGNRRDLSLYAPIALNEHRHLIPLSRYADIYLGITIQGHDSEEYAKTCMRLYLKICGRLDE